MSVTPEPIGDPVVFVNEHPEIMDAFASGVKEVDFLGSDIDLRVEQVTYNHDVPARKYVQEVSPALGNLYVSVAYHRVPIEGGVATLRWYPSAAAVNKLSEDLGNTPGETVMKFTPNYGPENNDAEIPYELYTSNFLRAGLFPQGHHQDMFHHDRDTNHAIGVICAPAVFTERTIILADWAGDAGQELYRVALHFDEITNHIGQMAAVFARYRRGIKDWSYTENELGRRIAYLTDSARFFDVENSRQIGAKKEMKRQIWRIFNTHFEDLFPKIKALQEVTEVAA